MKPHSSSRPPLLLALGLLLAPAARAAEPAPAQTDLVALHPCAVTGEKNKDKLQDYQAACATEVARGEVQLVPSDRVLAFLDKEPRKSCALAKVPAECLGRLATATQASRAVLITVSPGQLTRVFGLVVNPQGEVVDQKSIQLRSHGEPQAELIRTAVTHLRKQLNLAPLKPTPRVEQPPPVAAAPPPPPAEPPLTAQAAPPPPQAEPPARTAQAEPPRPMLAAPPEAIGPSAEVSRSARTWKTPVAYAAAGAGVVALGLAGFFVIDGNHAMAESNKPYANGQYPPYSELDSIAQLRDKAHSRRTLAGVSTAVGAALAGAGVYLWLNDRPASPAPGVAALSVGPGGVSLQGFLP